jgi:FKBP-type peptidyl-prolyl cis-trans isomerase SlyD
MDRHSHWKRVSALCLSLAAASAAHAQAGRFGPAVVEPGRAVALEYTVTRTDGEVVQSNVGGEPFRFVVGRGQILPALEAELDGLGVSDRRLIRLSPARAYGVIDAGRFREVPLGQIPLQARQVGAELTADGYAGPVFVEEVRADTVLLNFNHPLAGQSLTFDIRVLSIE